ncbi:PAS domain S-box protein [Marinobacter sp. F3R08]|uniref:PAS domain S-box protein n=1 Tax=Marinobacter sp. F3R08 TaxID=2841559 RepID=UPI001C098416|nr:PAS domain S-box protein [Marinobacter sp. F3R08]MBU2955867.1 PAS domain S-box protein [Marinobacter sp. F3R08]
MTTNRFRNATRSGDESRRISELIKLRVLDSPPERHFDDLVELASLICDKPIALVSLGDRDRQWFKAAKGISFQKTGRDIPFCAHAIQGPSFLEIVDTQKDKRFAENPLGTGEPGFRYYAGVPLIGRSDFTYGTLCVLDTVPNAPLTEQQRVGLERLARLTVDRLEDWSRQQQADLDSKTLATLLEFMPDAVVSCDSEGNLAEFNRAARDWHGVDPRSLAPTKWAEHFDLYKPDGKTLLVTEEIPLLRAWRREPVRNTKIVIRAKEQPPRVVLCNGDLLADDLGRPLGAVVTMSDITELQHAYSNLNDTRGSLQAVIDASVGVAIIATDTEGRITLFNSGAETLLGYRAAEVVGTHTPALFHLESEVVLSGERLSEELGKQVEGFDVFVARARDGVSDTSIWTYVRKDGEHRTVRLSVSRLKDEDDATMGYLGMAVDITEQRQAEREARLASERFGEAFNSAAQGMALVSLEGCWMDVNEAATKLFGYSREELLATDFQTLTHPDDLESDLTLLHDLLAGRIEQYQMKKRYYRSDGTTIYALLSVGLVVDEEQRPLHFVSQIQDVSSEHHALQQLKANRAFLQQLFDSLADAVLVLDVDTRIVGHNWAASELFELPSDATGSPLSARLPELAARLSATEAEQTDDMKIAGLLARWNTTLAVAGKEPLSLELSLSQVRGAEEPALRWVLVARDLSESERNELLKNQFVSTVSHELRTPLTSISGSLGLIAGGALGELPDRMEGMLRIAQQNTRRLIQLVNDLLDLNKLSADEMNFSIQRLDVSTVLEQAIEQMMSYAEPYGVRLRITGDTSGHIKADPDRLLQILLNLISNACKFSPQGESVDIHCEPDAEDGALISVVDRGSGIPESFRSRIFERFAQAQASDNRAKGGTGLGLAVTRELVERMGGVIGFESREGEGARFWFRFPRAEVRKVQEPGIARVLHVEDDADLAAVVRGQLASLARVDRAETLREAHERLRQVSYDLILLDLKLEDGNGLSLWETIHRSQPSVPVVILSGYEVPRAIASKVAAVVQKASVTPGEIEARVSELLKERSL